MESTFLASFECDDKQGPAQNGRAPAGPLLGATAAAVYLLGRYGGASFEGGLYRLHAAADIDRWTKVVARAFPDHAGFECFATDWLGRQFALSRSNLVDGVPGVLMFEPGTGEVLTIPTNFLTFHTSELMDYADAALARSAYQDWLDAGGVKPTIQECIGYTVPMFLGGPDTIDNMEKTDMEVYWELTAQMLAQVKDLPPGTPITEVKIK